MSFLVMSEFETFDEAELAGRLLRRKIADVRYISVITQKFRREGGDFDRATLLPIAPGNGGAGTTPSALVVRPDWIYPPRDELSFRQHVRLKAIVNSQHGAKNAGHILRGAKGRNIKMLEQ